MLLCQVLSNDNTKFGYNAATGQYEDLMAAGIIDPTKVCSPPPATLAFTIMKLILQLG
jgi:chaperonin GroEL (HSP60 family)